MTDSTQNIPHFLRPFRFGTGPDAYGKLLRNHFLVFAVYFGLAIAGWFVLRQVVPHPGQFDAYQQVFSRFAAGGILLHILLALLLNRRPFLSGMKSWLHEPGEPLNLGIFRWLYMGVVFAIFAFHVPGEWFPRMEFSGDMRTDLDVFGVVLQYLPVSYSIYKVCWIVGLVATLLASWGLFSRYTLIVSAICAFYVIGTPNFFGKLNHYHILFWIPLILAASPAGDAFSLDAIIRKKRTGWTAQPAPNYGIPLKVIILLLGILYFFAGWRKLWETGFSWALSENMVTIFQTEWFEAYDKVPAIRIDKYPVLCKMGGVGVLIFEMGFIFMIFHRKLKWAAFGLGLAFHFMTSVFLYIDFINLKITYWAFIPFKKAWKQLRSQFRQWRFWLVFIPLLAFLIFFTGLYLPGIVIGQILVVGLGIGFLLNRLVKKKAGETTPEKIKPGLRAGYWTWGLLLGGVWLCALLGIHSWPWSSYPTYSWIRKPNVEFFVLKPVMADGSVLDLDAYGKEHDIRKENFMTFGDWAAYYLTEGDSAQARESILRMWNFWHLEMREAEHPEWVEAWFVKTPVDPDRRSEILEERLVFRFKPDENIGEGRP